MMGTVFQAREPLWVASMPLREDGTREISSVLIANRGEIACRVIATCRKLHIKSIAIYTAEDARSRHVLDADEAINLGSVDQPGGNPFLNIDLIVKTAASASANAIHPGYGYLSENAAFADAVRNAGIIYIGPGSDAITTLGDKREAKEYLIQHEPSIPLIPGFTGSSDGIQLSDLEEQSEQIGFPVMIKASAGGGGKGMRIVRDRSELGSEFARAQSEAKRSFGRSDCILEKYIEVGKHVEVQIVGDRHGNVISLWERDCSVQRRHQKVIEESPCTWLDQEHREAICAAAVRIGQLLSYEGAGTVEFIVDINTRSFYFLEVNARLQVEHPITEECTGLDIVSLQLFVASGGNLASIPKLKIIPQNGHALECRLCAEDPNREFSPQHGLVRLWAPSSLADERNVRFETAIESGVRVSIHFDSMIAKIIVWAPTRPLAIEKMSRILADTACIGVTTNQLFLQSCLLHEKFRSVDYATSFIPSNLDSLLTNPYLAQLGLPKQFLSLIPGLFLRNFHNQNKKNEQRAVFGGIRHSFRNQIFDKINVPCDIISLYEPKIGAGIDPQICLWKHNSRSTSDNYAAQIAALSYLAEDFKDEGEQSDSDPVTQAYNKLSTSVRAGELTGSVEVDIKIHKLQGCDMNLGHTASWTVGQVEATISSKKLVAYIATGNRQVPTGELDTGEARRVFCHFPSLGVHFEYLSYSLLSFFESQRAAIAAGSDAGLGTINAPMPCKVLRVLKKEGDKVKTGEVVMVVESMKMEMTICAGKEGCFETNVKEGDAIDEGSVLCILS